MYFHIHKSGASWHAAALTHLWWLFVKSQKHVGWKWSPECLFPNLAQSSGSFYLRVLVGFWKPPNNGSLWSAFNKGKHEVLHLRRNNLMHQYVLGMFPGLIDPKPPSWPSTGLTQVCQHLASTGVPKPDTVLQMCPHKCHMERSNNFPQPSQSSQYFINAWISFCCQHTCQILADTLRCKFKGGWSEVKLVSIHISKGIIDAVLDAAPP